uniref:Calponin-homology (CH) domain-containing protein n=1 Tax=Mola mola TaxID=94237 RepID=A0A3Q3VXQ4_MOLML
RIIQPTSLKDPKFENLKEVLVDWINSTLKPKNIRIQHVEEDLYDGLVLHHLLSRLAGVHLSVEEIVLTSTAQIRKLEVILEELDKRLGLQDGSQIKWNVKLIHSKDLLATIHLLVAMVRCFQPNLDLPPNVKVESLKQLRNVHKSIIKCHKAVESCRFRGSLQVNTFHNQTECRDVRVLLANSDLAILHFVNQKISTMGLQVVDMDKQFADGVILLMLIGQLEGFFIPLHDFILTPVRSSEMVQYGSDIVSQDSAATLKVLYTLFKKHKGK